MSGFHPFKGRVSRHFGDNVRAPFPLSLVPPPLFLTSASAACPVLPLRVNEAVREPVFFFCAAPVARRTISFQLRRSCTPNLRLPAESHTSARLPDIACPHIIICVRFADMDSSSRKLAPDDAYLSYHDIRCMYAVSAREVLEGRTVC